jgi:endonuclease-3
MDVKTVLKVLDILAMESTKWNAPVLTLVAERSNRDPYQILISTILSLRTKDEVTHRVSKRLFSVASTPYEMVKLDEGEIRKLIYPVGFYRVKAKNILKISRILIDKFGGKVPDSMDELLKLPGVGRKTANIVLNVAYGIPAIAVDTHVHRISNRWGFIRTKNPQQTEEVLRKKLPVERWNHYNDLLVAFGQTLCKPIGPKCNICPIEEYCPKIGVKKLS